MTTYLGVGAVRIQTWLGHTPKLTHLRGASQALRDHTAYRAIESWLDRHATGVHIERAAGDVDGVVALRLSAGADAATVAARLISHVHQKLPGVQWSAWWCEDDSYLKALSRSLDPDTQVGRLTFLPALQDATFVESCPQCRREALSLARTGTEDRTGAADVTSRSTGMGADCTARYDAQQRAIVEAKRSDSDWSEIPGTWPDSFDVLASKGGVAASGVALEAVGRRESRSHLATIAGDGNGIGGLVKAIADSAVSLDRLYEKTVALVNDVMKQAVIEAARNTGAGDTDVKVVIPHYVGGDDVLLSVPAVSAWGFAITLAKNFEQLRDQLIGLLDEDVAAAKAKGQTDPEAATVEVRSRIASLSLGIGMVFASTSHPFAETSALAHTAMDAAKKAVSGRRSAIAWMDLTAESRSVGGEGGQIPWIAVADASRQLVNGEGEVGTDVFALAPSARAQLGSIVRDTLSEGESARHSRVQQWAKRTQAHIETPVADLPAALSRARWWPATNMEEER